MARPPRKKKEFETAKAMAYSPPPAGPIEAMDRIVQEGLMLRQRMIARLELQGIPAPEIAVELGKQDGGKGGWCLENVLYLTGLGTEGTAAEREDMRARYSLIREEVSHPSMIDVDTQLKEGMSTAISTMRELMTNEDPKIRLQASSKMLSMNGADSTTIERRIIELRIDPKLQDALSALAQWTKPKSRLDTLLLDSVPDDATRN